ncbi:thiamine diphosphokinase [Aquibacillus sediminis]|uniref:thiamine diphosphokinase n=1 Tax=Aquibacillus sediminis TaxID=2574734 RepID=UPI001108674C|nr:thiamine diphosphokinase [Aquibacillus sediminis]
MSTIAIVAGGPKQQIPQLDDFCTGVTTWIGADQGAITLLDAGITPDLAIGDFDSITDSQKEIVKQKAYSFQEYPIEKDETDLELAIDSAIAAGANKIYLFGVTGGRMDHGMVSVQLLYRLLKDSVEGVIIDQANLIQLYSPGTYHIKEDKNYPNISFLPFSKQIFGISLEGFYYKLSNADISWGSTLCISNKLLLEKGTFSFNEGILLVIRSRDVLI